MIRIFLLLLLFSCCAANSAPFNPQYHLPFTISVQPNTILPTEVAIGSTVHAIYQITNSNRITARNASIISLPPHTAMNPTGCGATSTFTLHPNESCTLTLTLSSEGLLPDRVISGGKAPNVLMACWDDGVSCAGVTDAKNILRVIVIPPPSLPYQSLMQDVLIDADIWNDDDVPAILSANYGFEGIEGVPGNEAAVIFSGGAWETITTPNASYAAYTTSQTSDNVATAFGYPTYYADAMPICFNWPVLPSTVNSSNFRLTLNTGEVVQPAVASITPNLLYNKRSCVVIFGQFGNRLEPGTPGAVYPTLFSIVDNGTTMMLYGPNGPASAVGLTFASGNPYQVGGGPKLIGAKINTYPIDGQCAPEAFNDNFPNGGDALYGVIEAQFRLRIYTTAGTSPDGVSAILPSDFSTFFQIEATHNSEPILLTETNVPYLVDGGEITILGLADLAKAGTPENDAYVADRDNYLDIVLKGDAMAMRSITAVIIPASGSYKPLYNPGGPGNNPTPGVIYTYPGPYWYQPVTLDLNNEKMVTYNPKLITCLSN
ncbi:MAG: hypothetical protein NTW94_03365 [Legionellales bacterium]|nr:hypothetical protein [Legionellales bacterium]